MSTAVYAEEVSQLRSRLFAARSQTDALFELIKPEAMYDRPIPDRHRLIFYFGHLEAFDWNQICRGALSFSSFHPSFDKLFEFGIDPEPGQAPRDTPADWPRISEVLEYNRGVRARVDEALSSAPAAVVQVAVEHRLMHAETFAYLLHAMTFDRKRGVVTHDAPTGVMQPNPLLRIPVGTATLGQSSGAFGWDNEFARHTADVPAFWTSKYKITNGEYLRFVRDGAAPPHFWVEESGRFCYRGMFGLIPLPLDWPVYVTFNEAAAYARSVGKRLLSEAEFHRAAYGSHSGREHDYPWGDAPPGIERGNFDFHRWDPIPVHASPSGDSAFGVSQLVGNGWEWTSTPFSPFPGFEPFPFYPGYSAPFFDGKHFVIKGGSPRTAAGLLRRSFRNWFRPEYPYLYATFRLAENA